MLYNVGNIANIFNNYKWNITFKNCKSLYCIPVTYIILYINYTSIRKKNFFKTQGETHLPACLPIQLRENVMCGAVGAML